MNHTIQFKFVVTAAVGVLVLSTSSALAFEGRIRAVGGRGGASDGWLYTVGTNCLRVEMTATNFPNAIDVVDLKSGQITLIQPMNQTFVRFTPGAQKAFVPPPHAYHPDPGAQPQPPHAPAGIGPTNLPGMPALPAPPGGLPPGIGPQAHADNTPAAPTALAMPAMPAMPMPPGGLPPGVGPQAHADAAPALRTMPAMPMIPPGGGLELKATGERTNRCNYPCERYEIKQNDQTMEIWATDQLLPFQMYLPAEPPRFAPPMIEEQWAGLVAAKKLFPLSAILTRENGMELYRFEVQSIVPGRLTKDELRGFLPPEGYVELQARPF